MLQRHDEAQNLCLRHARKGRRPAEPSVDHRLPSLPNRGVEFVHHLDRRRPVDARVGDADAMLQVLRALGRDVLSPVVDVRLNHDASDVPLARRELLANRVNHQRLVIVVFLRVAV